MQESVDGLWARNHFPVIMESNMSWYFNEIMYSDMEEVEFTFPTLEFRGFHPHPKKKELADVPVD